MNERLIKLANELTNQLNQSTTPDPKLEAAAVIVINTLMQEVNNVHKA